MRILAIESSCDETACAVVEDGRRVLSNQVATQIEEHKLYGGVVPEIASRRHAESIVGLTREALANSRLSMQDIDAVAVTAAPGLIGALLVGVNFAKGLSFSLNKPLIPVHHLRSHVAANYLCHEQLKPPFLCLVASGGHSHIVEVDTYTDYRILGKTRDDAAGEAFDKVARAMGLPYPGGAEIDKASKKGDPNRYALPTPRVDGAPLDFSFSGLKTAVLNLLNNARQKGEEVCFEDLAASFQKKICTILVDHTISAARQAGTRIIAAAGGVCANSGLREELARRCGEEGYRLFMPDLALCGDNAAMVGSQAYYEYQAGHLADLTLNAAATMSIDENF